MPGGYSKRLRFTQHEMEVNGRVNSNTRMWSQLQQAVKRHGIKKGGEEEQKEHREEERECGEK